MAKLTYDITNSPKNHIGQFEKIFSSMKPSYGTPKSMVSTIKSLGQQLIHLAQHQVNSEPREIRKGLGSVYRLFGSKRTDPRDEGTSLNIGMS
ncbi:hypothetical protein [Legionella tunisiensis]|uniref:hypothetical protein n=1 Tax=Legionella tunisiensis TaxID=1034944 RepID=UPI000381D362|nr:hypothetical protein [Legionella tunisiensis]